MKTNRWYPFIILALLAIAMALPVLAAPYLVVTQTVPDTFVNDVTGQLYRVTFRNAGDQVARNVSVAVNIPDSGFTFRGGTVSANLNGTPLTVNVSGTDPATITFTPQLDLAVNDVLEVTYRIGTDATIRSGEYYVLHVTGFYNDGTNNFNDQDEAIINVRSGLVAVSLTPISPDPFEAYRDNQVVLEARVTNNGEGSLFTIPFRAEWGAGFNSPQLIPGQSNITPTLNGNRYEITIGEIPAGESRYFRFQLTVSGYQDFGLNLTASDPTLPGVEYTDSAIFNLLIHQPNLTINAPNILFEYGNPAAVDITITNNNASGQQGPARQFFLTTTIDPVMTITDLAAGWTYAAGVFTYTANGGTIAEGQTIHLTFTVVPKNPAGLVEGINGYILMTPSYRNDIDQTLNSPIVSPSWSVQNVPRLWTTVTVNSEGTDGDNFRVFLGEQITYITTAHLTNVTKWLSGQDIVYVDNVPAGFTVTNATVTAGIITRVGNNITWTMTPIEAVANPVLTVNMTTTSNPDIAGGFISNTALIAGTTIWNCTLSDTDFLQFYLQSRDGTGYSYESKAITNLPAEGSYDVCGKDNKHIIQYQIDYTFSATSSGTWSGSWFNEDMNRSQVYVAGSAEYRVGAGPWTAVPGGSVTAVSPLTINLGFLQGVIGNNNVAGQTVSFRYQLALTNASLAAGTTGVYTFVARTDLMLNGATGGHVIGSEHHFYQGVLVPISRAAMNIRTSIPNSVTKGEIVRVTVTVDKYTPWDNNNLTVTIPTGGHYSYIGNPTYTGFGGLTPVVALPAAYPDTVTFTLPSALEVNQGGTISFDVVKTDDSDFSLTSQLDFDDDLSVHQSDSYLVSPLIQLEANFSITVNPSPVKVTTNTLTWQISVTNIGSGRSYDTAVADILKNFMVYQSSTIDGVPATPTNVDLGNGTHRISWSLGDMDPNQTRVISITVQTDGSSSDFSNASEVRANPTWRDRDSVYHNFNISTVYSPTFINLISSTFVKNSADNPIELCESGIVKLYIRNNGLTTNYNLILVQDLQLTNFDYIPGSASIGGVPINDPQVVGAVMTWTYQTGQPNYLARLAQMIPQEEFTIEFRVQTHENFNLYQKIKPSVTWQKPYEFGGATRTGTYDGAEYRIPILQPNIVLTVDGRNVTAGAAGYTDNVAAVIGETVEWRVQITNSGTAAAKNVTLNNTLPATMTFSSFSPPLNPSPTKPYELVAGQSWKISDIPVGSTATYYIRAVFNGPCGPIAVDTASVTWGQESGLLSTPTDNNDTANLISQPQADSVDISITNFTTKQGHVVVTFVTSGASAFTLNMNVNLTDRFVVDSAITYSAQLQSPGSEPALNAVGNNLVWTWAGPVAAGTHTITFDIRDNNAGENCSNNASITPVINYSYRNSSNDPFSGSFNSRTFTPAMTTLTVTKTPALTVVRTGGSAVSWTIQVTNTGTANATDLEIIDVLGDGFTYVNTTSPAPTTVAGNTLTWSGLTLNVGQTYTITVNATVNATGLHTESVIATEWNRDKTRKVYETAPASAAVCMINFTKAINTATGVAHDPTADSYGELVTFTITADFLDSLEYSNRIIEDTLPTGMTFVSQTLSSTNPATTITPNHSGKNLRWDVSGATGTETVTIVYVVRIIYETSAPIPGAVITNSARMSLSARYSDGATYNFPNTMAELRAQQSVTVLGPNATITSTRTAVPASGSSVVNGQTINHTLTISNANAATVSPAYEVQVRETIPIGERASDPSASVVVRKNGTDTLTLNTDYTCTYNSGTGILLVTMLNTALGVLQRNETYVITFSTVVDSTIAAGVTLTHSARLLNYYSQPSTVTGSRNYAPATNRNVTFTTDTSAYTLTIVSPVSGLVKPGDTVRYRISFTVPDAVSVYDVSLANLLPAGLSYVSGSSTDLLRNGVSYRVLTPTVTGLPATGQTLTWAVAADNVDISNTDSSDWVMTIEFDAVVLDAAAIAQGNTLTDTYTYNYNRINGDGASRTANTARTANLTVNEPQLTVAQTILSSGPYEAGQTVQYRIFVQNSSTETAYDLTISDLLPAKLTLSGTPTVNPSGISFSQVGQQLTWGGDGNLDLAPGGTVTIVVSATLNETVEPREIIGNTAALQWTSQNGANANERTYNLNSNTSNITINDATNMTKTILGTPTYVIGETFHYQLTMTLTRGTTDNVIVYDTLPAGVEFVSASITPNGSGLVRYTLSNSPSAGAQGAINWNFGSIVVPGGQSNTITIDYVVRIMNVAGNQAGQVRTNSAYLNYRDAANTSRNTATRTTSFTIKEPALVISKSYAPGSYQAGDTVTCTIRIWHNSPASPNNVTAYDLAVIDQIPAGMTYVAGSSNLGGALNGSNLEWTIASLDTTHDVNDPLILTYQVVLTNAVQPGQTITGNLGLTWSSMAGTVSGERNGVDGTGGLNDYVYNTTATLNATNLVNLTGTLIGANTRAVGENVSYQLLATLNEGTNAAVVVKSVLPAGMKFVSATISNGNAGMSYTLLASPAVDATGELIWDFGTISNPANASNADDTITITMIAVVQNVPGNSSGTVLSNVAHLEYRDGQGAVRSTTNQTMTVTVIEPVLGIDINGPAQIAIGQQATLTVTLANTGNSTAWQTRFTVTLPVEMRDQAPQLQSLVVNGRTLAETGPDDYDAAYDGGTGIWTITLKSVAARIAATESLVLTFRGALNSDETFTIHTITAATSISQYYSLDSSSGVGAETRTYPAAAVSDTHDLTIQTPIIVTNCTVDRPIAHPFETVRYTVTFTNNGNTDAVNSSYTVDMPADYAPGTLQNITASSGSISSNTTGGANGTGQITISNITISQSGTVTLTWDIILKPVLPDGRIVDGTSTLTVPNFPAPITVDLADVVIDSRPILTSQKRDTDVNGNALLPGEIIRYTIIMDNSGNETAINAVLKDSIPSNTTYVPNSTTLNGIPVADAGGTSALVNGIPVNTPGAPSGQITVSGTLTVEFQVRVNDNVAGVTIIPNQAELTAAGEGSGNLAPLFSDDPDTPASSDATLSVVGTTPSLYAHKTVTDNNGGQLMPGETITYQIVISNSGVADAMVSTYTDYIPSNTTFVPGSIAVNGSPLPITPSGGQFTCDLGIINPGAQLIVTYQVTVDAGTNGQIVTCQGSVDCIELPPSPSDADGNPANGFQPTEIPVGSMPLLRMYMWVTDINGGNLATSDILEYTIQVTNNGASDATNVIVRAPIPGFTTYVAGTTRVAGASVADQSGATPLLAGINIGTLAVGETIVLHYRVQVNSGTPANTVIDNQANYTADAGLSGISDSNLDDGVETGNDPGNPNDDDPTRVELAGNPTTSGVSGTVWWDQNLDNSIDTLEARRTGWTVEILQGATLVRSTTTDSNGAFEFIGLIPGSSYQIRFRDPVNGQVWRSINNITLLAGTILANQNNPIHPTGIIYDALGRSPIGGAVVTISGPGGFNPATHLLGGAASQTTGADGMYHFEVLFTAGAPNGTYSITVTPPTTHSPAFPSTILAPQATAYDPPNSEPLNRVAANATAPTGSDLTTYYLRFDLTSGDNNIVNNHIALDPFLEGSVTIAKSTSKRTASLGDFIPYTIRVENRLAVAISNVIIEDRIPPGFKYVRGSAKINGVSVEPTGDTTLRWPAVTLPPNGTTIVTYILVIGTRAVEGQTYQNTAAAINGYTGTALSNFGIASVRVIADPTFASSLIIGKVFYDKNGNGVQDEDEPGIAGVKLVTTDGQIITTDEYGRYHIDGLVIQNDVRGQNVVVKVDPRSVPPCMVFTTENPRVIRITQGVMVKVNFGLRCPEDEGPSPTPSPTRTPKATASPVPTPLPSKQ